MSLTDDFLKGLNKRNVSLGEINSKNVSVDLGSDDFTKSFLSGLEKRKKKKEEEELAIIRHDLFGDSSIKTRASDDDIAPVKEDSLLDFFQKGSFEDGYQFGDITKTILGTTGDVGLNVVKGAGNMLEGIADTISYGIAGVADAMGNEELAERGRKGAQRGLINEWTQGADDYLNQFSVLGRTSDAVAQGIGQVGTILLTGGLGQAAGLGAAGVTALTTGTMGMSGMGSGMSQAYQEGATDEEAVQYGMIAGAADALSELMFGGLGKAVNATGLSTGVLGGVDDILAKKVSNLFSSQIAKNFAEFGIKASAEGLEEVVAGIAQAMGKKLTYMSEEELSTILKDENLLEQFVVGMATSGIAQTQGLHIANKTNTDFITGQTQNEQAVLEKEVEKRIAELEKDGEKLTGKEKSKIQEQVEKDMEKGYISTDTIEETLGGETWQRYKDTVDKENALKEKLKAVQEEFDTLNKMKQGEMTGEQIDRRNDLKLELQKMQETVMSEENHSIRDHLKQELGKQVSEMVRSDRLIESYNEKTRRTQAYQADLKKYDTKQRAVIENAQKSGILNNTNRTHEFVDMVAKIAADKGVLFDFTNNAKLKESGFAVEGKVVNGYVTKDGITVNIQSPKALNSTVGHEITHVLEGTDLYTELQNSVIEYAKTKGDYQTRFDALTKLYENVEGADINAELTADLVGDYLFTDENFIQNLSVNNRNVFQKIYDEVKYLLRVATAGSKEARQMEKVKRTFEKAYRESTKVESDNKADTKYSLVTDEETLKFLDNQELVKVYRAMQEIDGELYPPMAAKIKDETGKKSLVESTKTNTWYQSDEHPELIKFEVKQKGKKPRNLTAEEVAQNADVLYNNPSADALIKLRDGSTVTFGELKYKFELDKANGSSVPAAYNPYFHTSLTALNDQFSSAYDRPNLVVVEGYIPKSELTSGYQAQYAKNPVGEATWHAGPVASQLKGDKARRVFLSRWFKADRVVPDAEAAKAIAQTLEGEELSVPWNVVTPSLRAALEAEGVKIDYKDIKAGSKTVSFASTQGDTQYSLSDSEGRQLSKEQSEYFKDSAVRDKDGNLMVLYHGTQNDFTEFDIGRSGENYEGGWSEYGEGIYLTPDKKTAEYYGDNAGRGREVKLMEVYANIKSLFNVNDPVDFDISDLVQKYELTEFDERHIKRAGDRLINFLQHHKESVRDYLTSKGYDGVWEKGLNGDVYQVVAYAENQIKNTDNAKPTSDLDIRYSLGEDSDSLNKITDNGLTMTYVRVPNQNTQYYGSTYGQNLEPAGEYMSMDTMLGKNKIEGYEYGTIQFKKPLVLEHINTGATGWKKTLSDMYNGLTGKKLTNALIKDGYDAIVTYDDYGYSEIVNLNGKKLNDPGTRFSLSDARTYAEITEEQQKLFQRERLLAERKNEAVNNPELLQAMDDYSGLFTEMRELLPKRKQGTATQEELDRIEEIKTLRDAYLNRVAELQESLGLNAISQEETEIRETKEALRIAADAAWAREGTQKENVAIEKSGLSAPEYFRKKALKAFKTTTNFNEAGYMLPDGKLLNFSGGERNHRYRDHREIGEIYEATQGAAALNRFLNDGNIRIMAESPGIDIASSVEPTKEQYAALRKFINTNGSVEGQFFVDFSDMEGRNAGKYAYTGRIVADRIINDIKYFYQNGKVRESSGLLDFLSLSEEGTDHHTYGNYNVYGSDVALEAEEEIAPVAVSEMENTTPATVSKAERVEMFPDEIAPDMELESLIQRKSELETRMQDAFNEGNAEAMEQLGVEYSDVMDRLVALESEIAETEAGRLGSIQDTDAQPEVEAPYYEAEEPVQPANPMADRNIEEVGNRKVKAYMYENPEVKPFFQAEARVMLGDLSESIRGEKIFNGQVYYDTGGEKGWMGTKRQTTAEIADLLDNYGYTYAQIEKGLNAIIEDNGKENNAVSKRIEFALNDRLRNGYTNVWGEEMPPDQDYIRLLQEKEINEYSQEAFENFMANADQYAPEDIAPVFAPVKATAEESQVVEDIAPTFDVVGKKGVVDGQQAFLPDAGVEPKLTRKLLHQNIVDRVKNTFHVRGFEFDDVLKKAKDLSTFATVDNTPQRVMEKALGYKQGQILSDLTVNKVAQNETEGIKWLNSFTDRKNGLLAQISKQYNIKPGSKQSAAAQMYAEGFYVGENDEIIAYTDKELAADFPDPKVRNNIRGLANDPRIREIYDQTLAAINESRTRNAYPEIPRLDNYFLHFRAMEDTFSRLGLPFNPNDIRAKDLPTDLNGVTADLKPGQPYFASAMHRTGKRTSFDLLGGLEKYLTSAKNQIYHIDDIQTLRALRNYVAEQYGQATGLENLNEMSDEEAAQRIEAVYDSHLSTFAKFLNEEANVLAGKTALIDRGLEGIIGRRGITFLDTLNRQVGSNMVGYNISSSLTNFIAPVQALAKSNKADFVKGFAQTAANKVGSIFGRGDSFAEESPVMIRRKGAERFYRTPWQKLSDPGYILMGAVDDISTELIARAKYNEFTRQGMDSQTAHIETDKWVSRLMGDRSLGQQPQLYNSKMLGIITKFQLEVRNQLDSQFYDTIQEAKASTEEIENKLARNAKKAAKITSTFVQLAVAQHLFGKAFESIAGYNPAFDIIEAIIKAFGWDDDEEDEDTVLDNIEQGFFELMGDMPYVSTMTGGRIPLESALPIKELYKGEDQYGNEKSRWETLSEAAPYWLLPGGYGQIKKTKQGLGMFDEDLPIAGSYTDSGKLRFPVEDTPINRLQAALFGQYASENARDYFDNERKALGEKQIEEFIDSDLPIRDYWEYREGLSGLDKLSEKADYIDSLDLPISTKNLFINNIADRKERIDMTGYGNYSSFEEFDFAKKNPEKYSFLKENGVSVDQYNGFDEDTKDVYSWAFNNPERYQFLRSQGVTLHAYKDFDKQTKEAYGWAYENPDSISLAKTVGGIVEYNKIAEGWKDLDAKDEFGNTVSGLKKQRVYDYIYGLDIPEAEKHILFKSRYTSDDSHNYEIIDYLNNRSDISYDEMIEILKKLKFEVDEAGNIYW